MEPLKRTYDNQYYLTFSGVAKVKQDEHFNKLFAKFGPTPNFVLSKQKIAKESPYPTILIELCIFHDELLGVVSE